MGQGSGYLAALDYVTGVRQGSYAEYSRNVSPSVVNVIVCVDAGEEKVLRDSGGEGGFSGFGVADDGDAGVTFYGFKEFLVAHQYPRRSKFVPKFTPHPPGQFWHDSCA